MEQLQANCDYDPAMLWFISARAGSDKITQERSATKCSVLILFEVFELEASQWQ